MLYEIAELSTVEGRDDLTYVLVHFWSSRADHLRQQPPVHTWDFLMQLRPTGSRRVYADGVDPEDPDAPYTVKEFEVDIPAQIAQNVEEYWERLGHQRRGDLRSTRIRRDTRDPRGVLSREDVIAMRTRTYERDDPRDPRETRR